MDYIKPNKLEELEYKKNRNFAQNQKVFKNSKKRIKLELMIYQLKKRLNMLVF